jgi:Xaa-Pro aminopeptidase
VGYLLNVHEGPQSFGTGATAKSVPLEAGMLLTIEPGLYIPNSHGIRIENLVVVKESKSKGFLEFETLTVYTIDESLVDWTLMSEKETKWLKDYNMWCLQKLK